MMEGGWANGLFGAAVPIIGAATLAAALIGAAIGQGVRRWHEKRAVHNDKESEQSIDQGGALLGATLGTFGLLLAFSFGMVLNRYESRRELVIQEANAIGTAYLRTQLLDEPYRSRLSSLLIDYTANRIGVEAVGGSGSGSLAENDRLLTEIWSTVRAARESALSHGLTTALLMTFNEVIDLDTERKVAWQLRLPGEMLVLLISYLVVTAGVVGYQIDGPRGRRAALVLFPLTALAIAVLADINRPMSGQDAATQRPLVALLHSLQAQPPAVFGGMAAAAPGAGQ